MSRPIHFEIHASDVERAKTFYEAVFGWKYEDYSDYAGFPYFGVETGPEEKPGINGAIMERKSEAPIAGQAINATVMTMGVAEYDETESLILRSGGTVALPKYALPGMAWQGYYIDTEGNLFGIHQPDENAK